MQACSAATPTTSACGVAEYGDMELIASWAQCNRDLRLYVESFLGHPATQRDVYGDGSTIFQVEQVQKPVLILHGLLDTVVAPETSEQWVEALRKHDKVFEYKTCAGEPTAFLCARPSWTQCASNVFWIGTCCRGDADAERARSHRRTQMDIEGDT
ncbi:MAG: prolyl oligopeptidase family serine peptidase [Caldilineaceae bacterium]